MNELATIGKYGINSAGTFVYRCRWSRSHFADLGGGHVVATGAVSTQSCCDGLLQLSQQLLLLCSLLQMLPLPADAFFQLLQLIVGLVPPQVLQPLGG